MAVSLHGRRGEGACLFFVGDVLPLKNHARFDFLFLSPSAFISSSQFYPAILDGA